MRGVISPPAALSRARRPPAQAPASGLAMTVAAAPCPVGIACGASILRDACFASSSDEVSKAPSARRLNISSGERTSSRKAVAIIGPIVSIVPPCFGQIGVKCVAGCRRPSVNPPAALNAGDIGLSRGAPMQSTLKPKQTDDPHDVVVVAPDVVQVAPADEELSRLLADAARPLSDQQTHTGSDLPAGPPVPPVDTTFRPAAVNNVHIPGYRRWIGGPALRGFTALLLAGCIGVASIAWQSDAAKKMIAKLATQLMLTTSLPQEKPGLSAQPALPAVQSAAANAAPPQPAPPVQTAPGVAPAAAALSPDSAQLLQSMARDLATAGQEIEQLKASVEQLKAGQQQMSRDVAKASEQNSRPRIAAPPPRPAAARARNPMPPPYPPRQAAAAPALPQATAPYYAPRQPDYVPRQVEPQPQTTAEPQAEPEASSAPRPPMPVR